MSDGMAKTPEQILNEALAAANLKVVPPPPAPAKSPTSEGSFIDQSGQTRYRYIVEGQTWILPKPIEQMKDEDYYDLPITLSSIMHGRLPQNLTVEFKDSHWAGYWFNKSARDGLRLGTARALGFIPAKIEDLKYYDASLNDKDGAVEQNDLVLMKIHKVKIMSLKKMALDTARVKGGIGGYKSHADATLLNPKAAEYYHTPQALGETQGLGPVTPMGTGA